jgi:LAGLIDADG endonuclease
LIKSTLSKKKKEFLITLFFFSSVNSTLVSPHWVTGFCDRSACFSIIVSLRKSSGKWEVRPVFEVLASIKHLAVLERIGGFFGPQRGPRSGVGKIYIVGSNASYRVTKLSELVNVIIPHFIAYPLLTSKTVTFTVWALAVSLFEQGAPLGDTLPPRGEQGAHKTTNGFMQIISIYAAIGRGASEAVLAHFPNLIPYTLPAYTLAVTSLTLNGYCTLYCDFSCYVTAGLWKVDPYHKLRIQFCMSCNVTELLLMQVVAEYLGANLYLRADGERVDLNIANLESALSLVNFFNQYPLQSAKHAQFLVWGQFVGLASKHRGSGFARRIPLESLVNQWAYPRRGSEIYQTGLTNLKLKRISYLGRGPTGIKIFSWLLVSFSKKWNGQQQY